MTPVQLPEVPAPRAFLHNMAHNPLYTAAQLREYATEAVRLNLEAIKKWPDFKKLELMRRYDADRRIKYRHLAAELGVSVAFIGQIIKQARAMSSSETNSER